MGNIYNYLRHSFNQLLLEVVAVDTLYLWKVIAAVAFLTLFGIIIALS